MSLLSRLFGRFGYVKLKNYGLALTIDKKIVPLAGAEAVRNDRLLLPPPRSRPPAHDPMLEYTLRCYIPPGVELPERPVRLRAHGTVPGDVEPVGAEDKPEPITDRIRRPTPPPLLLRADIVRASENQPPSPAFIEAITADLLVGDDTDPNVDSDADTDLELIFDEDLA